MSWSLAAYGWVIILEKHHEGHISCMFFPNTQLYILHNLKN